MTTCRILQNAVSAKQFVKNLSAQQKNSAIEKMACILEESEDEILRANAIDVENARGKISDVMIDRLTLNHRRISEMADGMRSVARLSDPNGKILSRIERPNGLVIEKTAVPLGVIGIIYESRPNVTSDAAVLCFKSSNVCVLRAGKEAYNSSKAIVEALRRGLEESGITPNAVQLIDDTTRASANEMMTAVGYIDLLIPRGGKGLIQSCAQNAKVPCVETGTGIWKWRLK